MKNTGGGITSFAPFIILLVAALVLFSIINATAKEVSDKKYINNCWASAKLSSLPGKLISKNLDCPRRYITFFKDSVELEILRDNERIILEEDKLTEDKIKRRLAEEIANCWYMMQKGESKQFDKNIALGGTGCILCSIIEFNENIQKEFKNKEIKNFKYYLQNKKKIGTDQYYYDYLARKRYKIRAAPVYLKDIEIKGKEELGLVAPDTIDTGKTYNIIYVGYTDTTFNLLGWVKILKNKLGKKAGFEFESSEFHGTQYFIEADDYEHIQCDYLYN